MKNIRKLWSIASLILVLSIGKATAQNTIEINTRESAFIGKNIEYLVDTTGKMTLQEAKTASFLQCQLDILNLGNIPHNVWMRFSVKSNTEESVFLEIQAPLLETLEIYEVTKDDEKVLFKGGFLEPFANRPMVSENWLLNLDLNSNATHTYYIKGNSGFPFQVPVVISSKESLIKGKHGHNLFWGLYIGIMIFALLYNLFIYISVRERTYLYYILYILGSVTFYLGLQGFSFQFFWPNLPYMNSLLPSIICITNIIITLFTMRFLKIDKSSKVPYYMGIVVISLFVLIAIVNVAVSYAIAAGLAQMVSLLTAIYFIYAGIRSMRKGVTTAKFYLLAWTSFLILVIIFILTINNVFESNFFTTHCIFIGHMTEVLLLSFALADRINFLKKENEQKQLEIIHQLEENKDLQEKVNRELESKVQERTTEIQQQNILLAEKNQEISDSITYAHRIQRAILPTPEMIKAVLPKSFLFFKPKDIVSGDFYWFKERDGIILFAVADCTGHGVPGALVSVVCHNALNRSVRDFNLIEPAKILDKTREFVIDTFDQSNQEIVLDGMDISLFSFNLNTKELQWAGANNPLCLMTTDQKKIDLFNNPKLLRNKEYALITVEGDRQPIGKYTHQRPFTNHSITLCDGEVLYIFSDGYADQFGGLEGKKFNYKAMKQTFLKIGTDEPENQAKQLEDAFNKWRGNIEQLDDVCVMGLKI